MNRLTHLESQYTSDVGDLWTLAFDERGAKITCTDLPEFIWSADSKAQVQSLLDQLVQRFGKAHAEVAATSTSTSQHGLPEPFALMDFLIPDSGTIIDPYEATWLTGTLFIVVSLWEGKGE